LNSTILQSLAVLFRISSSDAASSVDFEELTKAEDDFVNLLGKLSGGSKNNCLAFRILGIDALKQAD